MQWLKKIRQALIRDIAAEVFRQMKGGGWGKFLPPVAFQDCVYLVREDGAIYRMHRDQTNRMEIIMQIRS